jgi:hypothetical protein
MPTTGVLVPGISRRTVWDVTYNSVSLGLCDDIDPSAIKMEFEPIVTGSTGKKNVLGQRFVGISGMIKIQLRQLNMTQYAALAPWSTGTPIQLVPPLNADMYAYAQTLTLHPDDMVSVTTEDLLFTHAVPMQLPGTPKRTGGADDVWEIEFAVFPDRTVMSTTPLVVTPGTVKGS